MPAMSNYLKMGCLAILPLLFLNISLQAQVNCSSKDGLRACGLGDSHTLDYEIEPKEILFTTRSLWGNLTLPYDIEISPLTGSTFSLFSNSGEQLDINLTFRANDGEIQSLTPGNTSNFFTGTGDDAETYLIIELVTNQVPSSSSYSASFEMTLNNYFFIFNTGTETVAFDIVLNVEPNIVIRNLGDVNLGNSGTLFGQPIEDREDFCIGGKGFSSYTVNLSSINGSTGGNGNSAYELTGSNETISYAVAFSDNLASNTGIVPGNLGDVPGSFTRTTDEDCLVDNARVYISIAPVDWQSAQEPIYTDVLTVTVSSQ
ncbi:hypothetical protein MO867_15240 [Microbulbifer sp. OS29]|uniref:Uncharacterized protein n=1 Tax=Microbulbifer okhotskensis TaxID=2926617 RepID=A0A9X2EQU0_9GAMM|nr:hypothetical protein [Microbulbifer okhotskensis]MCO1335690.1 hypothetical protein [Microbulbifer okhotskensis]